MKKKSSILGKIKLAAEADEALDMALAEANDLERYAFLCRTQYYPNRDHVWGSEFAEEKWDDSEYWN